MYWIICVSHSAASNSLGPHGLYSPPGSSVHSILQVRILEWVYILFFRSSSWPIDWTQFSCFAGRFFTVWATREASGSDGSPTELFEILKYSAVKVLHSTCQKIWKTQQWSQNCKRSVFITNLKKGNTKECSNYCPTALISHAAQNPASEASAVCELRTSRCINWIEKRQKNQRSNCQHSLVHKESKGIPEEHLLLLHALC